MLTILSTFTLLASSISQARALDKHLWKHRVIIIFSDIDITKELIKFNEDLTDRHIICYQIKSTGKTITNNPKPLTDTQLKAINNKYLKNHPNQAQDPAEITVILVGKDGKLKQRANKLNFKAIFALIDTMPMRQNEMQSQKK